MVMRKVLYVFVTVFVFVAIAMSLPFWLKPFSGAHYCLPWVDDKGPGTVGCFYSSPGPQFAFDQNGQLTEIR